MANKNNSMENLSESEEYTRLEFLVKEFIRQNQSFKKIQSDNTIFSSYALSNIIEQYEHLVDVNLSKEEVNKRREKYWENKNNSYVRLKIGDNYKEERRLLYGNKFYFELSDKEQQKQLTKVLRGYGAEILKKRSKKEKIIYDNEDLFKFVKTLGFYANPYILNKAINLVRNYRPKYKKEHVGLGVAGELINEKMREYAILTLEKMIKEVGTKKRADHSLIAYKWVIAK